MKSYRKKPVVIQAIQWDGSNTLEILEFGDENDCPMSLHEGKLELETLEGVHLANPGDFIIRGVNGELYPCKPDIFFKTYDEVEP